MGKLVKGYKIYNFEVMKIINLYVFFFFGYYEVFILIYFNLMKVKMGFFKLINK